LSPRDKINIHTLSFEDFLLDHPDGLIEYDSESTRALSEKESKRVREETKKNDSPKSTQNLLKKLQTNLDIDSG